MDNRQCCTPGKVDVIFASLVWTLLGQDTAAAKEAWKESQGSECWHAWSISSYKKLQLLMKTCSKSDKDRQEILKGPNLKLASELSQSNDKSFDSSIYVFVLVSSVLRGTLDMITTRQHNIKPPNGFLNKIIWLYWFDFFHSPH